MEGKKLDWNGRNDIKELVSELNILTNMGFDKIDISASVSFDSAEIEVYAEKELTTDNVYLRFYHAKGIFDMGVEDEPVAISREDELKDILRRKAMGVFTIPSTADNMEQALLRREIKEITEVINTLTNK